MIGFMVAAFCLALSVWSLLRGSVWAIWPMKPVERDESPGEFWTYIIIWLIAAAAGIGYGLRPWIWGV